MLRKRIFRRILFGPAKRVAGTLANIIVFDIAMTIYRYLKKRVPHRRADTPDEEIIPRETYKRRW
jgi:hypothetical protein